ncbi:MAG: type II secretion system protein N [Betaproteobacteria bacterium]
MKILALPNVAALMLLVAATCFVPAALLDARLDTATKGQLRLADTAGTIWRGRGIVVGQQRTWSLPVEWTLDPGSLIKGEVVVALHGGDGADLPRGTLAWRHGTLTLDDFSLTLPAAAFDSALAAGSTVAVGGQLTVVAPHFGLTGDKGEGSASARWTGARIAGNAGTLALGTVTVDFTPRDGSVGGRIANRGGDVRVEGELTLGLAGSTANVTLTPLPATPPAITRALSALGTSPGTSTGTPDATGAVRVQWRSSNR